MPPASRAAAGQIGSATTGVVPSAVLTRVPLAAAAVVTVAARPELRGSAREELLGADDDGDGCSGGDTQVLQEMNEEDHGVFSFWLA